MKARWINVLLVVMMMVVGIVPSVSADSGGPITPIVPAPSAENGEMTDETPSLWFVELSGAPVSEGNTSSSVQSEQKKFALAAIAIMILVAPIAIYKVVLKDGDPERMEEIFSLTGRLPFWKALINEGLPREPLLGFGFMRIDYKEYFQGNNTYPGKMTHNTFMQVLMNLGLIGLVIVMAQFIFTLRGILRENAEKKLMLLCLLIPLLINSFTEFGIFGESNYGILFYQLILMYISFKSNTIFSVKQKLHLLKTKRISDVV